MKPLKKVVLINGSPKKERSTTLNVAKAFIDGLKEEYDVKLSTFTISDLHIKPCLGCLSCWGRTPGECVIKDDDIHLVKEKIEEADYVIESYPLYFFGMPGTMKVFTDRMLSMMMTYRGQESPKNGESFHGIRNPKEGRKFIVISSCAYTGYEAVFEPLIKQYDCICGKDNYLFIPLPQLMTLIDLKNQAKIDKYLAKFKTAGAEFAKNGKLSEETQELIKKPPFTVGAYKIFLGNFWEEQKR